MNLFRINPRIAYLLLPFVGGALYSFGFPMKSLPHFMGASFLGLFLLFQALPLPYGSEQQERGLSFKPALISVLCFSLGYCLFGYYWIPYTLKEFGHIYFPFNTIIGSLFSLIIVPQFILFALFLNIWSRLSWKKSSLASGVTTRNVVFSILLVVFETYTPQQFPAHIGHTWLQLNPYLGSAPIFGVPAFSFFSYWLVLSLVSWWKVQKVDKFGVFAFVAFLAMNLLFPLAYNKENSQMVSHLRMVQANVGNFMKIQSEQGNADSVNEIYERYKNLSLKKQKNQKKIDLILWPETAYPRLLNTALMRVSLAFIPTIARDVVTQLDAPLFFGGYDKSENNNTSFYETEYNAAFFISPKSTLSEVYHKRLLIPFGESLPFGFLNPYFARVIKNISFFAKGQRFPTFQLENRQRFISVICYEVLFSGFIRKYLNEVKEHPNFLVNLTNDSWYGETSEPYQHQFLSHWRSLEFQIPMVRMTNTGITSILYPDGSESERLGIFEKGILDVELKLNQVSPTPLQKCGFLTTLLLMLIMFIFSWLIERFKN